MKKILFIISIWAAASLLNSLQAQIITVTPGTDMTIKAGTIFSADSLVLTPAADFTLSNLNLVKSSTVNNALLNPYIARVYQFSNKTSSFKGAIQLFYRDGAELKGIAENKLSLNIYNGNTWNAYPPASRDAVNNYVLTSGLNCIALKELTLAADCPPPVIQCNADTQVIATANKCGATVSYRQPVVTDGCGIASVKQTAGLSSGAFFPVGCTVNTFVVTSSSGKTATCSFRVTVLDKEPPHITQVSANPATLWPPNHQMQNVTVNYNAWDNCGTVNSSLSVTSNEPIYGTGDGDKGPDWVILDNHHIQLRAERAGNGNGRIYVITITSTDAQGNSSSQKTTVLVPHNKKGANNDSEDDDDDGGHGNGHHTFECKVIPNPSTSYFILQITSGSGKKIEANLLDMSGKRIARLNAVKNQTIRFGDNLRPGSYVVEIIQGNERKTITVIKQ